MAEPEDLVGKILLGKLEVLRKIGGGGMGVVYEVVHRLTGHRRALKVVHAKYADRPRFMKRLLREAKVAGTLQSPYVVETYDAGRLEDGSAYVLMELLEGRSLYQLMQDEGRLAPRRLAEIMSQVAEGMSVAHAANIVHRDLKPENIFVIQEEDRERVKILDFGVSKFEEAEDSPTRLTIEGTLVGTPYYMSPEQAAGRAVDARTDVYAMGVMMYEALTGRLPFEAESVGALFVKIGAGEYVPLSVRRPELEEAWRALVERALHRDPEQRFPTSEALRHELVQRLGGGTTAARAKTLSDGARATLGYSQEVPARTPSKPPPEEEDEALALSPPPPELKMPARPGIPAWAWAAGGALAVLLVVATWRLAQHDAQDDAQDDAETLSEPLAAIGSESETEAPAEAEPSLPPPPSIDPPPLATDAGARPPLEEPAEGAPATTPRNRPPSRATQAGLDPNPYRR